MFLFVRNGEIEIATEVESSKEAIQNEIYHQLFQSGAIAERTSDGVSFRQGFLNSMARKAIAGISCGNIIINKTEKGFLMSYQFSSSNYFIGSVFVVFALTGVQWLRDEKLFSVLVGPSLLLIALPHIISPLEFKIFLRQCVKASSTKR